MTLPGTFMRDSAQEVEFADTTSDVAFVRVARHVGWILFARLAVSLVVVGALLCGPVLLACLVGSWLPLVFLPFSCLLLWLASGKMALPAISVRCPLCGAGLSLVEERIPGQVKFFVLCSRCHVKASTGFASGGGAP
jgi:hypothetical protein